jgi:hypothetical protein
MEDEMGRACTNRDREDMEDEMGRASTKRDREDMEDGMGGHVLSVTEKTWRMKWEGMY